MVGWTSLRIQLLGGFQAWRGAAAVSDRVWRLRRARMLVKLLALAPGHRMHREELMELLWPDAPPAAAANSLHQALHAARRALADDGTCLALRDEMLHLGPTEAPVVDVEEFTAAAALARRLRDPARYDAAVALYTGDLLPEERYEDWAVTRREDLRRLFLELLVELAALHEARDRFDAAAAALERAVAAVPSHEPAHVALMSVRARAGRTADALRQYERLRGSLDREVGEQPSAEATSLYERIRAGLFPPLPSRPSFQGPSPDITPHRSGMPAPLTSFVGREVEVSSAESLLPTTRLMTLTGPGGAGKTRLALEVASRVAHSYPGAAWVVELAALADGTLLDGAVAATLGVQEHPGQAARATLAAYLRPERALLLLDNCEHVASAAATLVAELLRACPRLRVLATSREALGVPGELLFLVSPMGLPPEDVPVDRLLAYDAVRLFVERARFARPGFALTPSNAAAVGRICRRLEGMPLAIELAAARVGVLSPEAIAARLQSGSYRLLTSVAPAVPPRQRSLEAAVDWSYDLLSDDERRMLDRLSVFAGGWTLEAAEAVCAGAGIAPDRVLSLIARLVDKSLIVAHAAPGEAVRHTAAV